MYFFPLSEKVTNFLVTDPFHNIFHHNERDCKWCPACGKNARFTCDANPKGTPPCLDAATHTPLKRPRRRRRLPPLLALFFPHRPEPRNRRMPTTARRPLPPRRLRCVFFSFGLVKCPFFPCRFSPIDDKRRADLAAAAGKQDVHDGSGPRTSRHGTISGRHHDFAHGSSPRHGVGIRRPSLWHAL